MKNGKTSKITKQLISFGVLLTLCLSLCSCGSETSSSTPSETDTAPISSTQTQPSAKATGSASANPSGTQTTPTSSDGEYVEAGEMKIRIFKIGKADAVLIRTQNNVVLIDSGEDEDGAEIIEYLNEKRIQTIDYMIITHYDKRALGGADTVLNNVTVKTVIGPNYKKSSTQYVEFASALKSNELTAELLTDVKTLTLDDTVIKLYPAEKTSYVEDDDNNFSILTSVVHGKNSFLFCGGAMSSRVDEIIKQINGEKYDFLLIPNYGTALKNLSSLLDAVSPAYVGIVCSTTTPADPTVVNTLADKKIKTYQTINGAIKITSLNKDSSEGIEIEQSGSAE